MLRCYLSFCVLVSGGPIRNTNPWVRALWFLCQGRRLAYFH